MSFSRIENLRVLRDLMFKIYGTEDAKITKDKLEGLCLVELVLPNSRVTKNAGGSEC